MYEREDGRLWERNREPRNVWQREKMKVCERDWSRPGNVNEKERSCESQCEGI